MLEADSWRHQKRPGRRARHIDASVRAEYFREDRKARARLRHQHELGGLATAGCCGNDRLNCLTHLFKVSAIRRQTGKGDQVIKLPLRVFNGLGRHDRVRVGALRNAAQGALASR